VRSDPRDLRLRRQPAKKHVYSLVGHPPKNDPPGLVHGEEDRSSTVTSGREPRFHGAAGAVGDVRIPCFVALPSDQENTGREVVIEVRLPIPNDDLAALASVVQLHRIDYVDELKRELAAGLKDGPLEGVLDDLLAFRGSGEQPS